MGTQSPVTAAAVFYGKLKTEGLRLTHQYQISFVGIPADSNVDTTLNELTMFAQGLDLPQRTQNFAEVYYLGYPFQQATNMTWSNEINMTINCDAFMKIRDALLFWQGIVTNPYVEGTAKGDGIKTASEATMRIDLYDQTMSTVVETYVLYGIVPSQIGDMTLSNQGDSVATFPVTFKFQYWSVVPKA